MSDKCPYCAEYHSVCEDQSTAKLQKSVDGLTAININELKVPRAQKPFDYKKLVEELLVLAKRGGDSMTYSFTLCDICKVELGFSCHDSKSHNLCLIKSLRAQIAELTAMNDRMRTALKRIENMEHIEKCVLCEDEDNMCWPRIAKEAITLIPPKEGI